MTLFIILSLITFILIFIFFKINKVTEPFSDWRRVDFQERLLIQSVEFGGERWMIELFKRAANDSRWDPSIEFDGCTTIQDLRQPCAPCFIHDWMWKTGQGGKLADKIFYHLLLATGCKKSKAKFMFVLVRVGWATVYRRKHLKARNVNAFDKVVFDASNALNIT